MVVVPVVHSYRYTNRRDCSRNALGIGVVLKLKTWHPLFGHIESEIPDDSPVAEFLSRGMEKGLNMAKPQLSLYLQRTVVSVIRDNIDGEWGIELDGRILILNKHPNETFPPGDELVGSRFDFISMSLRDTTMHFRAENGHVHKVSFPPTYYVIADPIHGGKVYPQWPEELERRGVPATPEGGISDEPSEEWPAEESRLRNSQDARVQSGAQEFLAEEEAK